MKISIDFDGTIVKHDYPNIGEPVPHAIEQMEQFLKDGHELILWTMRSGKQLNEAVEYLIKHGISLHGINEEPNQEEWTSSPKPYAHIYIDDAAYGCPLVEVEGGKPYVDWSKITIKKV